MTFFHVATLGATENIKSDSRVHLWVLYLLALLSSVAELIVAIGVSSIFDDTRFGVAALLMAWDVMKVVD